VHYGGCSQSGRRVLPTLSGAAWRSEPLAIAAGAWAGGRWGWFQRGGCRGDSACMMMSLNRWRCFGVTTLCSSKLNENRKAVHVVFTHSEGLGRSDSVVTVVLCSVLVRLLRTGLWCSWRGCRVALWTVAAESLDECGRVQTHHTTVSRISSLVVEFSEATTPPQQTNAQKNCLVF
jgi:hypothetical protein